MRRAAPFMQQWQHGRSTGALRRLRSTRRRAAKGPSRDNGRPQSQPPRPPARPVHARQFPQRSAAPPPTPSKSSAGPTTGPTLEGKVAAAACQRQRARRPRRSGGSPTAAARARAVRALSNRRCGAFGERCGLGAATCGGADRLAVLVFQQHAVSVSPARQSRLRPSQRPTRLTTACAPKGADGSGALGIQTLPLTTASAP